MTLLNENTFSQIPPQIIINLSSFKKFLFLHLIFLEKKLIKIEPMASSRSGCSLNIPGMNAVIKL
jgi:hypothetical protein